MAQLQSFKAELFKALSHPTRIRILELLRDGEKGVSQLQLELGAEGSTVSQQLAILRMKNLVDTRRAGNAIYYRLRDSQINHVIQLQSLTEEEVTGLAPTSREQKAATRN